MPASSFSLVLVDAIENSLSESCSNDNMSYSKVKRVWEEGMGARMRQDNGRRKRVGHGGR